MKLLRLTVRIKCRPWVAGPLSSPIRNPATQTQKRELGTGETMKTLWCGRVACSDRDEGRNSGSMWPHVWKTNECEDRWLLPTQAATQSYVRLGAEMCIKIIYVQSLSHKILIMFWTWPLAGGGQWRSGSEHASGGNQSLIPEGEGISQTWTSGHHWCTNLFFLQDFLSICSKIKEIWLVKKNILLCFLTSCPRLHSANGTLINTIRWPNETSVRYT